MRLSTKGLRASLFAGAVALGFALVPVTGAQAASAMDRAGVGSAIDSVQPMEMQRRGGGFRGGGFRGPRPGPGRRGGGRGFGPGAALGLGAAALIIGGAAAAASANRDPRECWIERRWVDTPYGPERRRVRVCD
ncbi:hypothetical protein [Phreatobacter sp.]|uniref:hypothetical protein n=1 Tax=Phreatobacter sp. TaxID=1966341 RepID=UPI003F72DFCE